MRSRVEWLARTVGVGALLLALISAVTTAWRVGSPLPRRVAPVLRITAADRDADFAVAGAVRDAIVQSVVRGASAGPQQSALSATPTVQLHVSSIPSASVRAVLGAAARAGVPVSWQNASGVRALAVSVSRVPAPATASLLSFAATTEGPGPAMSVVVRDAGGILDSIAEVQATSTRPMRLRVARLQAPLRATMMRDDDVLAEAEAGGPDSLMMRRVRMYAAPGWEGKFVVAALEESGWNVDAAYQIAPTATVRVGIPSTLDTSRYAAAIVMDSGLVSPRGLRAFLAQGGGAIIAGDALRDPALLALTDARIEDDRAVIAGALLSDQPRRGIPAVHLVVSPRAIVLEREGQDVVVAVTRRETGRVLVSGFRESWRWRMEGNDEAATAHRDWWNTLVAAVAFAPPVPRATDAAAGGTIDRAVFWPGDDAPLADLVARIGVAESLPFSQTTPQSVASWSFPLWLLFLLAAVALLSEWALRRLRGAS